MLLFEWEWLLKSLVFGAGPASFLEILGTCLLLSSLSNRKLSDFSLFFGHFIFYYTMFCGNIGAVNIGENND